MDYARRINYSIDNIERSIVADTKVGTRYTDAQKKKLYAQKAKLIDRQPDLKKMINIGYIHRYPIKGVDYFARIGFLPTELVITDNRIKDMCQNQLWTTFRAQRKRKGELRFTRCPGLDRHSSCPYFSPPSEEVRKRLDRADIFIALQTKLFNEIKNVQWEYQTINRLRTDIEKVLGKSAIIQQFGAGPCQSCYPEPCLGMGKCRNPKQQAPALESMGVPVGQLCRDLAMLTGNKAWEIKWIKHFGFPHMSPKKWKVVFGLAVKLNGTKKASKK